MDAIQRELLMQVAGLHEIPAGAYNIRSNGQSIERKSTGNIEIINKPDKSGIEIHIKPGTKKESVHIPVIMSQSGLEEVVYNDFILGKMQTLRSLPAAESITEGMPPAAMTESTDFLSVKMLM